MNIFYKETFSEKFKPGEDTKSYIFGFLYAMRSTLFFTIPPFLFNHYGLSDTHCSLNFFEENNLKNVFKYLIVVFFRIKLMINLFQLIKVIYHYRNILKIKKGKHLKD